MRKFDPHYPYNRVYGDPLVYYEQLGHYYNKNHEEVDVTGKKMTNTLHLPKKK
jgi:hypothetical protein